MNMLGLAKRTDAKILLASTSEVYGDPLEHPQRESYWGNVNPIGERSCYDEGASLERPCLPRPARAAAALLFWDVAGGRCARQYLTRCRPRSNALNCSPSATARSRREWVCRHEVISRAGWS